MNLATHKESDMELLFKTTQFDEGTVTKHSNFDDGATWMEVTELFWKHLNAVGYHIDEELVNVMLEAAEDLQVARFQQLLCND